jgi:serralysin
LAGNGGDDRLTGSSGKDRIDGGAGADSVEGGSEDDVLLGGEGNDRIIGSSGRDHMTGGAGTDTFIFTSVSHSRPGEADVIADFATGADRIDLQAIDANTKISGNQAFVWGGSGAGGLVLRNGHLVADVNGDGRIDVDLDIGAAIIILMDVLL